MTMQTPTAEQVRAWMMSKGWQAMIDGDVTWWRDKTALLVPTDEHRDARLRIEQLLPELAAEHDLDPFVVRCQMLGFEPVTEDYIEELEREANHYGLTLDDIQRVIAHLRATGTVQP